MPITVVGSIAYDTVKTPFGERERMLGGAAVHFALAASFFDDVRVVGPVGDDFGERQLAILRTRGVDVSDVELVAGGKTFFWQGEYGWDLNSRETLDTQLGVFEGFSPKLSEDSRSSDVLFLANIQPDLQLDVRGQLPHARFVALDSMNLWIDIARDSLVRAIESVDCVILNDAELRQLTGKPNLVSAAREVLSWVPAQSAASAWRGRARPERDRRQAGRVRRSADHPRGLLLRSPPIRSRPSSTPRARATPSRAASSATSQRTPMMSSPTSCCVARWPTPPCSRRSTSRSSAPSASSACPAMKSPHASRSCTR
jgi:hypothetical protein